MGKTKRITQVDYVIQLSDGKDYKIRPLSLLGVKNITAQLKGLDNIPANTNLEEVPELLDKLVKICATILLKSNSSLKLEEVAELITVGDVKNILGVGFGGEVAVDQEVELGI